MNFKSRRAWLKWVVLLLLALAAQKGYAAGFFFREEFNNLEDWKPFYFQDADKRSSYTVESDNNSSYLKAESSGSISAILHKKEFDVYRYPIVRWKWKVDKIYENGDAKQKSGDDYPLRIYIMFKYDLEKAGFLKKIKYNSIRLLYGAYPPHSNLCYIWANREHKERILTSTYTDKVKLLLLQKGKRNVGKWMRERINILEDYRQAFGSSPPKMAGIAVINDSDNTGDGSVSFIDYIQVEAVKR